MKKISIFGRRNRRDTQELDRAPQRRVETDQPEWFRRLSELYDAGASDNQMANDPMLCETLLSGMTDARSRRDGVRRTIRIFIALQMLPHQGRQRSWLGEYVFLREPAKPHVTLTKLAPHVNLVSTRPATGIIFSYETPVAAILADGRRVRIAEFITTTTERQLSRHCLDFEGIGTDEFFDEIASL
jgi:hypothetical protein